MGLYFGLKRAREELLHLNLEIQRQLMFMCNDHIDYYQAIQSFIIDNPTIAHELSVRWEYQNRINKVIFRHLQKTVGLPGFSGIFTPGICIGRSRNSQDDSISLPSWWEIEPTASEEADGNWEDHGDGEQEDVGGLIDFMDNLAI
jgi:hypothetical protein